MKRINYGNREKYIATEEQSLKKKGVNWDRVVYLTAFFVLVSTLILYLVDRYVYLTLNGQVVNRNHLVYLPKDSWIIDVYVEEDEYVQKGDSLFLFRPQLDRTDNALFNSIQSAEASKERDLSDARRSLLVKQTEYNENLKLIVSYEKKIEEIQLMVLLDANNSERISTYQIEIDKLKSKNEVALSEIKFWRNYIENAPKRTQSYQNTLNARISDLNQTRVYFSPVQGHVDRLNYGAVELVYKGQSVLDLVQEEIFALCYLSENDYGLLMEGDKVSVKFSDGDKAPGLVKVIFANIENIPPHYQRNNSVSNDYFLIVIEPENQDKAELWEKNADKRVKVTKQRDF